MTQRLEGCLLLIIIAPGAMARGEAGVDALKAAKSRNVEARLSRDRSRA